MKLEVLLNAYLTWHLLLLQVIVLLGHTMCFCIRFRVEGEADCTCRIGQLLSTCSRSYIRCEGGLHRQIGWDRRVSQGGAGSGSCRKCNN